MEKQAPKRKRASEGEAGAAPKRARRKKGEEEDDEEEPGFDEDEEQGEAMQEDLGDHSDGSAIASVMVPGQVTPAEGLAMMTQGALSLAPAQAAALHQYKEDAAMAFLSASGSLHASEAGRLSMSAEALPVPAAEWDPAMMQTAEALGALSASTARLAMPAPMAAAPSMTSPVYRLVQGYYAQQLHQIDARLKNIRTRLSHREFAGLDQEIMDVRATINSFLEQFEQLKNTYALAASNFAQLGKLEEYLTSALEPQLSLYELDLQHFTNPARMHHKVAVNLSIIAQDSAGPIFKDRPIGPFTVKLLTGATITQIQSGPVQPELVESVQRVKRNNADLELARQTFKENATAVFAELKFTAGTFPALVRLRFKVTIQLIMDGQQVQNTIESPPSKPFISMTNTGSQWKDAAGLWLKEDCFGTTNEVSISRFWNYFQAHYLVATKQDVTIPKRPLFLIDFDYMLRAKFGHGLHEKLVISAGEYQVFWNWIGSALKRVRYQKHLLWLFESGYLAAFVSSNEATAQLQNELPGTFMLRLSERFDGEFVISYVQKAGRVRHYLLQPDDTADKKKTIIDFLGQNQIFITILQLKTKADGTRQWYRQNKNKVLSKHYKKSKPKVTLGLGDDQNPYDARLPLDLDS